MVAPYYSGRTLHSEGGLGAMNSGLTNLAITLRFDSHFETNREISSKVESNFECIAGGKLIYQNLREYLDGHATIDLHSKNTISYFVGGNLNLLLPPPARDFIRESVDFLVSHLIPAKELENVSVFAPEIDYPCWEIDVAENFSAANGIYVIGDCTGRFRGVLQAFCSGMISANSILGKSKQ
jgi:uncharacterized FAD-dependent dehydrogenase